DVGDGRAASLPETDHGMVAVVPEVNDEVQVGIPEVEATVDIRRDGPGRAEALQDLGAEQADFDAVRARPKDRVVPVLAVEAPVSVDVAAVARGLAEALDRPDDVAVEDDLHALRIVMERRELRLPGGRRRLLRLPELREHVRPRASRPER